MRYRAKVSDTNEYDTRSLKSEIAAAGVPVSGVHPGGGQLIIETSAPLTSGELTALRTAVTNHAPIWFEWTENGVARREKVMSGEEVDAITGQRIRRIVGGTEPIQTQLKQLRMASWAHEIRLQVIEGGSPSAEDIALADTITSQLLAIHAQIEIVRGEGKAFKTARGWE